jgi:hypothetical protein
MIAASLMTHRMADEDGDGGAGGSGAWSDSLPEDVRSWDEVTNSDSPEKFWQQMSSHRQHLGQSIRIPGADAGKEDWTAFNAKLTEKVPTLMQTPDPENEESTNALYTKMGKPAAATDYKTPEFKDAEGKVIDGLDAAQTEAFKAIAHKNGLSQKQFEKIVTETTQQNIAAAQKQAEQLAGYQAEITAEWGAAEDKNYTILKTFAKKTDAPEAIVKALENKTLDAGVAKWMLTAANASFGEGQRAAGDEGGGGGVMTPGEAKERQNEIMNNREHAYWKKMDPGHKAAVARVRELIILQNPADARKAAPGTVF